MTIKWVVAEGRNTEHRISITTRLLRSFNFEFSLSHSWPISPPPPPIKGEFLSILLYSAHSVFKTGTCEIRPDDTFEPNGAKIFRSKKKTDLRVVYVVYVNAIQVDAEVNFHLNRIHSL